MKKTLIAVLMALISCSVIFAGGLPYDLEDKDLDDILSESYGVQQITDTEFVITAPYDYEYNMFDEESTLIMMPSGDGEEWTSLTLVAEADDEEDSELRYLISCAYLMGAYGNPVTVEDQEALIYYGLHGLEEYQNKTRLTEEDVFMMSMAEMVGLVFSADYEWDFPDSYCVWMTDDEIVMADHQPGEGVIISWLFIDSVEDIAEEIYREL